MRASVKGRFALPISHPDSIGNMVATGLEAMRKETTRQQLRSSASDNHNQHSGCLAKAKRRSSISKAQPVLVGQGPHAG